MQEMTITEDKLNRMRKEEKVHISTSKHLFKKTINEKAYGCIDILAKSDEPKFRFYGSITGDYDFIRDFDSNKIQKAMEVLFNEKCGENNECTNEGVFRS